jgi:hypothetical protein
MAGTRPARVAIDHDDYHAEYVGRTADGRQFFLTTPFEPAIDGSQGEEYVALFLFDAAGRFLDAKIDSCGPRATLDHAARRATRDAWLAELGEVTYDRIEVAPFEIQRHGVTFGLVPRGPEGEDDSWWVELHPGNYMAFHEPFDSGEYDT